MTQALVIGATGATGKELVRLLLDDPSWASVRIFVRRPTGLVHPKLDEHVVDFGNVDGWRDRLRGDCLFSALGTTIKQAGSREAQYAIDFTAPLEAARAAAANGVPSLVLVSAAGANARSPIFYSRMKGELDEAVQGLGFRSVQIFRPGILDRPGTDRPMETVANRVLGALNRVGLLRGQRPMPVATLAEKMIRVARRPESRIYAQAEIFDA